MKPKRRNVIASCSGYMMLACIGLLSAQFAKGALAASLIVDNKIPQGNIFVAGINGDTVELHNEVRDTAGW